MIISFFCNIEFNYIHTFFGTHTTSEYIAEYFRTSKEDFQKFDAAFGSRMSYKKKIKDEIKFWVEVNVDRWRTEKKEFFHVDLIPDDYLPARIIKAEGGETRRRKSLRGAAALGRSGTLSLIAVTAEDQFF